MFSRYAEIVNVRLGDGTVRKGQVLEIAGKRAVVQVSTQIPIYSNGTSWARSWNKRCDLTDSSLYIDLRRYIRHWQLAHPRRVHRWCASYAYQHWDVGKILQRFRYSYRSGSPSSGREVPWYSGKQCVLIAHFMKPPFLHFDRAKYLTINIIN